MTLFARINHHGWMHLWHTPEAFELGEPSVDFFDPRVDPRWAEVPLTEAQRRELATGNLVAVEDPGYWTDSREA